MDFEGVSQLVIVGLLILVVIGAFSIHWVLGVLAVLVLIGGISS